MSTEKKTGSRGKYKDWLTDEGLLKLEGWARDGLTDEQIAINIGIRRTTLYDWKKKYSDISDALKKGKEVIDRQVENALFKSAIGYEYIEVTKERIIDTGQKKRHDGESELTEEEWEISLAYFNGHCAYCDKQSSMTKDHLDPLKNGGKLSFNNVIPACQSCNSSKKDNQWLSWYQKQKFYNKERAKKISEYIQFTLVFPKNEKKDDDGKLIVTKEVTKFIKPDTTAGIFWLKNRKPDVWRDKKETELSGGVKIDNPYENLTEEELRKLANSDG